MLSDDIRGLVVQARRNVRDAAFLEHVFNRLDVCAAELETMEESEFLEWPCDAGNVVPIGNRRERRDG